LRTEEKLAECNMIDDNKHLWSWKHPEAKR